MQVSSEVDSMEELELTDCGDDAKDDCSDDENKCILSNDRKSEEGVFRPGDSAELGVAENDDECGNSGCAEDVVSGNDTGECSGEGTGDGGAGEPSETEAIGLVSACNVALCIEVSVRKYAQGYINT